MSAGAENAAATTAAERTKSRREKVILLDMWRPPWLVVAPPHLHGFGIALNPSVFRVETQFPVNFPSDVGKLQHRNGDVANSDRCVELLALADTRDKVREVSVGHGITTDQVRGRSGFAHLEFACLAAFQVVDLVAIAINQHRARGSHNCRTAITAVILHSLATLPVPRNH